MDFSKKKILICGMGRSGIASAIILKKIGAKIIICDKREKNDLNLNENLLDVDFCLQKDMDKKIIDDLDLIILSPGVKNDLDFLVYAREKNIKIWAEIELAYKIGFKKKIIGITGTNGKTTVTSLVGEIIKKYDKNSFVGGNIGVALTQKILDLDLINKKNWDLERLIVAEISNLQLENIELFKPKVSVILNITPDHLDWHKTFENYVCAKERIFENQDENDFCVLNFDDDVCKKLVDKIKAKIVFFSVKEELDSGVYLDKNKIVIKKNNSEEKIFMDISKINLLGEHNIYNVLAAIGICCCLGVDLKIIYDGIINFKAVAHRLEFVREINGIKFYNDSKATNVDAGIKALEALKDKNIILIGGGYDKKNDFYDWIKKFNDVKKLILIGEVKNKIAKQCDELGFKNYYVCEDDLELAIKKAIEFGESGDYVLLSPACASWDMFKNFEERGDMFKKIINKM